jgi:hypothetical protein
MEFYLHFQKMHPQIKIGKRSFDVLHPFFVKQMKEWNVCCCIYHVEIDELWGALNNMHTNCGNHYNSQCQCSCKEICQFVDEESSKCVGALTTYPILTSLWESLVCPRDEYSKWHNRAYLLGICENCGVDNLPICHVEEKGCSNILISWKHYSTKKILTKKGEEKKKLRLLYKSSSFVEFISYLKLKLQYFMHHNFVSWW